MSTLHGSPCDNGNPDPVLPARPEPNAPAGVIEPLNALTPAAVADALLKQPARVAAELVGSRAPQARMALAVLMLAGALAYGLAMGCFAGGHQLWMVPIKLQAGLVLSALMCLPSLYILTALSGSRLTLDAVWGLLLMGLALTAMLLAGFAPVAWLFAESTGTAVWMGLFHLLIGLAAGAFGYRLLRTSVARLGGGHARVLRLWAIVFMAVLLQMTTVLRPMVGPAAPLRLGEKKFFLQHWAECMK